MITTPRPTRQVVPDPTREVVRRHLATGQAIRGTAVPRGVVGLDGSSGLSMVDLCARPAFVGA